MTQEQKQQKIDALKQWLDLWEPLYETAKQAIIDKHGANPEDQAAFDDLERNFAVLRAVRDGQISKAPTKGN